MKKPAKPKSAVALMRPPAPTTDPHGNWERAVRKLAAQAGTSAEDALDFWDERASIRQYQGEQDVETANAGALEDLRRYLFPQQAIAGTEAA